MNLLPSRKQLADEWAAAVCWLFHGRFRHVFDVERVSPRYEIYHCGCLYCCRDWLVKVESPEPYQEW